MAKKRRKKTKKTGVTARFGARYGKRVRDNVKKIEEKKRAKYVCPKCGKVSVKRERYAVWKCTKCGAEFSGGAYVPQTEAGRIALRAVQAGPKAKEVLVEIEEEEAKEE
ncbi:MAG: 50S ribosomal protein L37Ae [Candidatus Diapherotrites archaeon]|nr:50S ribosomal protein L37Ae [Candidatus Diapherotrites archaeon]